MKIMVQIYGDGRSDVPAEIIDEYVHSTYDSALRRHVVVLEDGQLAIVFEIDGEYGFSSLSKHND